MIKTNFKLQDYIPWIHLNPEPMVVVTGINGKYYDYKYLLFVSSL